jgi:hypothetical protein
VAGRIRSIEEFNDLIGNQTRDLATCSIVPQPGDMSRDCFLQIFWMIHIGNNTTEDSNRAMRRKKNVLRLIELVTRQFQKSFVPGKNIAIEESTVGFKGKIIF